MPAIVDIVPKNVCEYLVKSSCEATTTILDAVFQFEAMSLSLDELKLIHAKLVRAIQNNESVVIEFKNGVSLSLELRLDYIFVGQIPDMYYYLIFLRNIRNSLYRFDFGSIIPTVTGFKIIIRDDVSELSIWRSAANTLIITSG